jgi:hypothetical protein
MMDPKMDNGMTKDPVYDVDERLELNLLPADTSLSPNEIIGIMDQLIACEVKLPPKIKCFHQQILIKKLVHLD